MRKQAKYNKRGSMIIAQKRSLTFNSENNNLIL